ncbi:hypothetical protein, partial [Xanthomonas bonasiae]
VPLHAADRGSRRRRQAAAIGSMERHPMSTAIAGIVLAAVCAALSALALYSGSPNCRLAPLRRLRRFGNGLGLALAGASLAAWIAQLGIGAGLCAMLASWMLALMLAPTVGALRGETGDATRSRPR